MIKVVVVDDHPVVREGLKRILAEHTGMVVTGEAGDGDEALKVIRSEPCDVVVLDLAIPQKSGLDVLKELHVERPRLPILIVSAYPEDRTAIRCIRAGAAGYLKKETALTEVVHAIRKVLQGGKYVSSDLAEKLAVNVASRPRHEALSDREYQVLCMMGSGKAITEISKELGLSVKTVSTYRTRLLEKLMLTSTAELIRYAIKENMIN